MQRGTIIATRRLAGARPICVHIALLAIVHHVIGYVRAQDWTRGRATWYDDSPWMSVHHGSCMYGYLGSRFGGEQNWMVGAINDGNWRYSGSCGRCFELRCVPGSFSDALGNHIDRTHDCKSQDSVIIAITDTCPCYKPENAYSNKRWCCGDMDHFDVGVWAFRRMADPGKGVILIDYRPVDCPSSYQTQLNPSVQKPSALRSQFPWDTQQSDSTSQQTVTAFSGPSQSSNGPSPGSGTSSPPNHG